MIPTTPGTYYWRRSPVYRWTLVTVRATGEYGVENPCQTNGPLLELETGGGPGEWGPRIPDPDRLEALEELRTRLASPHNLTGANDRLFAAALLELADRLDALEAAHLKPILRLKEREIRT